MIQAIADRYEIDTSKPWTELTEEEQNRFLCGTDGEKIYVQTATGWAAAQYMFAFEGVVANLERRYKRDRLVAAARAIEEYMSLRPCPVCEGARLSRRRSP